MTNLAQHLSAVLREYLPLERRASINTSEAYAYTFQLLINFAANELNLPPSKLTIEELNVKLIVKFLHYLALLRFR
ncbi:MAG: integrase/recombinase XerD, partial [Arenicella sp.]